MRYRKEAEFDLIQIDLTEREVCWGMRQWTRTQRKDQIFLSTDQLDWMFTKKEVKDEKKWNA